MPRSQRAAQPSLNARTAERLSTAVRAAENRVSNTPARNAGSRGSESSMGEVVVILKIMPESPEVDLEKLQADIRASVTGIEDMKVEPIGFGLSALKIAMITEDDEGAGDKIEALFSQIPGIDRAEIESLNRLL